MFQYEEEEEENDVGTLRNLNMLSPPGHINDNSTSNYNLG